MRTLTTSPQQAFALPREDLISSLIGIWLVGGVFVDGWAHRHRPALETFLTPWHAIFYSGFAAMAVWILYLTLRSRPGIAGGMPVGYGLGRTGLIVFALGGIGDWIWHSLFGIEATIDALLSPTHLVLLLGALLIVTCPIRSGWQRPGRREVSWEVAAPAVIGMALVVLSGQFFFMYASAWTVDLMGVPYESPGDDLWVGFTVMSFVISGLFVVGAGLVLLRRWRLPFGVFTLIVGTVGLGMQVLEGFDDPWELIPPAIGGLALDWLASVLDPSPDRPRQLRTWATAGPVALWGVVVAARGLRSQLAWPITLWLGTIAMTALWGLALSLLASPPPTPGETRQWS